MMIMEEEPLSWWCNVNKMLLSPLENVVASCSIRKVAWIRNQGDVIAQAENWESVATDPVVSPEGGTTTLKGRLHLRKKDP